MAIHTYRVTRRLPWIEGGRCAPNLGWDGGAVVVHHPGATIALHDAEVSGLCHCLEATDRVGRGILDRARRTLSAPAAVTPAFVVRPDGTMCLDESPGSVHPNALAWLTWVADEKLEQAGRFLDLVLRLVARGDHPTCRELAAAQREAGDAPPAALEDYIALRAEHPRSPGPKRSRRTTWEALAIKAHYDRAVAFACVARDADWRQPRAVKGVAAARTARVFDRPGRPMSKRTVQRVVQSSTRRPWLRDDNAV